VNDGGYTVNTIRSLLARLRGRKDLPEQVRLAKLEVRAAGLQEGNPDILYLLLAEQRALRARLEWGLGVASVMGVLALYHVLTNGA
jgi:hypothetical protein